MRELGLSQEGLGDLCGVSKQAVSNWLSGESIPRPKKLKALCDALEVSLQALTTGAEDALPVPVVAYRTRRNSPASDETLNKAIELAEHLRALVPFVQTDTLFSPPVLQAPSLDDAYVRRATTETRKRIGVSPVAPLSRDQLIGLHRSFGSILAPVLWGEERVGHENALSVYLPDSKTSWVVLSLNARIDDFNYWLAHELGHCYTLHELHGEDGESFAERFAQELLFPHSAALDALESVLGSPNRMERARFYAEAYDISIVTVIRQIDRVARARGLPVTGLETPEFWVEWNRNRSSIPTIGHSIFGTEKPDVATYVTDSERIFGTAFFRVLAQWQLSEGGRSPSFIATVMNIGLDDAVELSHYLQAHAA